jgi:hypothetical protein
MGVRGTGLLTEACLIVFWPPAWQQRNGSCGINLVAEASASLTAIGVARTDCQTDSSSVVLECRSADVKYPVRKDAPRDLGFAVPKPIFVMGGRSFAVRTRSRKPGPLPNGQRFSMSLME